MRLFFLCRARFIRTAFTGALVLCVMIAASQDIAVKSFRSLPNDLDAKVSFPKEDKNGEKSAIIKVVTTETGFEFEAGMIGIVATVTKTSEVWVYVPRGSKALTIKHPKLGILRNYRYPEPVESGVVYEMVLAAGHVVTTVEKPEMKTQWLVITSEPPGADLYINDNPSGKTPFQSELPVDRYTWRLAKELYLPEAGVVELVQNNDRKMVSVKLKPDFGQATISSLPENGAAVSLNGISLGKTTPCTLEKVKSGNYTVTLSLDMYETTSQQVTIVTGETAELKVTMKPTFAEVNITSEPPGDIYINGVKKGNATWQGRLNPGIYTFESKLDKYRPALQKTNVVVGQPLGLVLKPEPVTGTLRIVTEPFDATVTLNGKEAGKTPMTLRNQLIGEYNISLSLDGYVTYNQKVNIIESQVSDVTVTLQKGVLPEITGVIYCKPTFTIRHKKGNVAPVDKTITYKTVTNIPGEPSKCWIAQNLGADRQATSVDYPSANLAGWYWQFNRKQGYQYDGRKIPKSSWNSPINENSDWLLSNDPCNLELGAPWRLPSKTEWENVVNAGGWKDWNGPWNSELKLHAAGYLSFRNSVLLYGRSDLGYYWSSSQNDSSYGWYLAFKNSYCFISSRFIKANGYSIRCIREH